MAYRTTVHHAVLRSEYNRLVGQWARTTLEKSRQIAVATAPRRGGWKSEALWSKHRTFLGMTGSYRINMNLWNDASYAEYVHEGTPHTIYARPGGRMLFPGSEVGARRAWVAPTRVRGQVANPWLQQAVQAALRSEGIYAPVIDRAPG